jgi:glycerol kinase
MPELILGLDVGTTSARALVFDLSGRTLGQARTRLESTHPAPGRVEQDPAALWKRVDETIRAALSESGTRAADLAAIGLAAQRSSVVIWDPATGAPLTPMILWSDLRGMQRAAELQALGQLAMPLAAVAKLEAAIDSIPDGRARARAGQLAWGTLDSYLVHRLSGGALHQTDYSNAWSTCYLDLTTMRDWNPRVLEIQQLPIGIFPDLCDTYGELGHTAKSWLGAEIPLGAIVADQQCGMFAHGALRAGDWKASYGTSATLMVATGETPCLAAGLTTMLQASHAGRISFAVEGMIVSAGSLLDWLVRDLGLFDSVEGLTRAALSVDHSGGVAIRPALQGLGAPHNRSDERAAILGLSSQTTRAEIARAALESLAFRMREIVEAAAAIEHIDLPDRLPVDGGVAANDTLLQIQADAIGRPVARHRHLEATALGACIAAALGTGLATEADLAPLTRCEAVFEPRIDAADSDARFEVWSQLVHGSTS